MGQAESRGVDSRAKGGSTDGASSQSFFSASIWIGDTDDNSEALAPIVTYVEEGEDGSATGTSSFFCAEKGAAFSVKCVLARAPPPGVSFGARVYVDSGSTQKTYLKAGLIGDEDVDTAEFDHYFWFGPGETEYVVRGFFADSETSFPFAFGSTAPAIAAEEEDDEENSPTKRAKKARPEGSEGANVALAKSVGAIRIQFAKVTRWMKPGPPAVVERPARRARALTDATGLVERKGNHIATVAADEQLHDGLPKLQHEAVLGPGVLFECRLHYNTFEGYRQQTSLGKAMLEPLTFQGLPLYALRLPDVRRRCVETFVRALQRGRFTAETEKRIWSWGSTAPAAASSLAPTTAAAAAPLASGDNDPVTVDELARVISATLSRAASYIVCVGDDKEGNYGEQSVQRFRELADVSQADTDAKKKGLWTFLSERPDLYTLTAIDGPKASRWLPKFGKRAYAVAFAECVILDDDDDGDD